MYGTYACLRYLVSRSLCWYKAKNTYRFIRWEFAKHILWDTLRILYFLRVKDYWILCMLRYATLCERIDPNFISIWGKVLNEINLIVWCSKFSMLWFSAQSSSTKVLSNFIPDKSRPCFSFVEVPRRFNFKVLYQTFYRQ